MKGTDNPFAGFDVGSGRVRERRVVCVFACGLWDWMTLRVV